MQNAILFGNGQNAALALASLSQDLRYQVVAFTVDRAYMKSDSYKDLPLVAFEDVESLYPPATHIMHISVSYRQVNQLRAQKYEQAKEKGYSLLTHINARAVVPPDLSIGDNCLIGPSNIAPYVEIGNNVVIASGCVVGHHTVIGDHCYVAPGAVISGSVVVEPYCFIGAGAVVRDRIIVRRASVVGAGAVILEDTEEKGVYLARPAQRLMITSDELPLA